MAAKVDGRRAGDSSCEAARRGSWRPSGGGRTSGDGIIGIMPSLKASSLETQRDLWHCWSIGHRRPQPVAAIPPRGKLDGCCRAHIEAIAVMVAIRSAAWNCVGGRCLQQRHRGITRLAADRGGSAQLGWAIRCGTSSKDSASDFSDLLTWWRRLCAWVKQRGEVDLRRRLG
ncbi:hypothetical protein SETIT_2G390700v2 [Setaria italica]|uniref:Uncharacterized protein n=1 Tax=Setaria italica TaxID=4555 RepID=A0A368Q7J2_SETIT|nr:hypothetical protein SETIT_2G390700v2 [Setaria italica]